jgi:hypothetical protein
MMYAVALILFTAIIGAPSASHCFDPQIVMSDDDDICADMVINIGGGSGRPKRGRPKNYETQLGCVRRAVPSVLARAPEPKIDIVPRVDKVVLPTVQKDALRTLVRPSCQGVASPHPLERSFLQLRSACVSNGYAIVDTVKTIHDISMCPDNCARPSGSLQMMSAIVHVPYTDIKMQIQRLSCVKLWCLRSARHRFEELLVHVLPPSSLLSYIEAVRHDETPLKIRMSTIDAVTMPAIGNDTLQSNHVQDRLNAIAIATAFVRKSRSSENAKILQSESRWCNIVKIRGIVVMFRSDDVCDLQAVETTQAPLIAEAQARVANMSLVVNRYKQKGRFACTDRYAANFIAEIMVVKSRKADWTSQHMSCRHHVDATLHNLVLGKTELAKDVQGLLRVALSLRDASALLCFQRCVRTYVRRRIVPLRGRPPSSTIIHRSDMLWIFCSGNGCKVAMIRSLLAALPNGDWERLDRIEVYIDLLGLESATHEDLVDAISDSLVAALCPSSPKLYPRHRWRGAQVATDNIGVIEMVSRILTGAYKDFVRAMASKSKGASSGDVSHGELAGSNLQSSERPDGSTSQDKDLDGLDRSPEANERHRKLALEYVLIEPLARISLVRITLQILQHLTDRRFWYDSFEFELQQRAKVAREAMAGGSTRGVRDYKITLLANNVAENEAFAMIGAAVLSESVWRSLPRNAQNNTFRCLCFRTLSRTGAAIQELHIEDNISWPIRKYILVHRPQAWAELRHTPPCLLDPRSLTFVTANKEFEELPESECVMLECEASETDTTIGPTEAKHASIRRLVQARSNHTHQMDYADLVAEWTAMRFRLPYQQTKRERRQQVARSTKARNNYIKDKVSTQHTDMIHMYLLVVIASNAFFAFLVHLTKA